VYVVDWWWFGCAPDVLQGIFTWQQDGAPLALFLCQPSTALTALSPLPNGATLVFAAAFQGPRRAAGDLEFAVRGGIDDLNASWSALLPRLAASYPFELDTFQKEAVIHLEQGHSVRGE
jgi:hypothetical protein